MIQPFDPGSRGHVALLAQLGLRGGSNHAEMLKSQAHHDALHAHLRRDGNDSHVAPANPAETIRRSSPDVLLTPLQRAKAEIERKRQERERAARGARSDAGDSDDDEDDETMIDGEPHSGSSLSKSFHKGAFQRMRRGLHAHMAKSLAAVDIAGESFEQRYGAGIHRTAHVVEPVRVAKVRAVAKPVTMSSVTKRMAALAKSLGNVTLAKSLEAGTNSDSATLAGGSALRVQSLQGAPKKPKQITAAQVEAACMKGLQSGAISGGEAAHICTALTMGHPLGGDLMMKVMAVHGGKA
jgi:hypothetical protein